MTEPYGPFKPAFLSRLRAAAIRYCMPWKRRHVTVSHNAYYRVLCITFERLGDDYKGPPLVAVPLAFRAEGMVRWSYAEHDFYGRKKFTFIDDWHAAEFALRYA